MQNVIEPKLIQPRDMIVVEAVEHLSSRLTRTYEVHVTQSAQLV